MKGFCEKCRNIVEYSVKTVNKEKLLKGKNLKYISKVAYCNECKEEIFVPEIRDYNLNALDNAYRDSEDLIKVNDIEKILEKYNIGKRPLSLLLGWGEGTLTRYIDGDTPTKPYSEILKQILASNDYYREILERNKDNISSVAYRKSMAAVDSINMDAVSETNKLEAATQYLLFLTSEITPLALQKLLYFVQGFHKAFTDKFIFSEDCEAWAHGPVYRDVFYKYREYGYNPIEEKDLSIDNINLTESEKELFYYIVLYFGCYSGKVLEDMTHSEVPWRKARHGLKAGESSDRIINKADITSYFYSVKDKYKMLNYIDIKDYSKDLFNKLYC
ncbi:MAG: DUF4065 domain-containing protein [Clostridiales bacterium]|nr:DUF4065 domain-containing protein [Clostridiales bacterium]